MSDLYRKVGTSTPDNLITGLNPPVDVVMVRASKLAAETTLTRGTVLAVISGGKTPGNVVILGTAGADAISEVPPTYANTQDVAIIPGKDYYTRSGTEPNYTYSKVSNPDVGNIANYYEMTSPGSPAYTAETLVASYVLAEDAVIGTTADVEVVAYRAGCFSPDHVTVKSGYTITAADIENLRMRNIVFQEYNA